ncbi:MAG: HPF/RaiA family ribosome-associated protein [Candidatus Eisenbacteria bacterium]
MKIEMQSRGIELTEHLKAYVDRRVRFALSRHGQHVRRIQVRLADLNGPRGGLDTRCQMEVFVNQGDPIVVDVQDMDAKLAVGRAARTAGRRLRERLGRRLSLRRPRGLRETDSEAAAAVEAEFDGAEGTLADRAWA